MMSRFKRQTYACRLYAHARDAVRFLLVCEEQAFPPKVRPDNWRLVVRGFDPPNRAKPWLKLNGHHEIWFDAGALETGLF